MAAKSLKPPRLKPKLLAELSRLFRIEAATTPNQAEHDRLSDISKELLLKAKIANVVGIFVPRRQ